MKQIAGINQRHLLSYMHKISVEQLMPPHRIRKIFQSCLYGPRNDNEAQARRQDFLPEWSKS